MYMYMYVLGLQYSILGVLVWVTLDLVQAGRSSEHYIHHSHYPHEIQIQMGDPEDNFNAKMLRVVACTCICLYWVHLLMGYNLPSDT